MKDHNTCILQSLLPFRFMGRHRPGVQHVSANFLSYMLEDGMKDEDTPRGRCLSGSRTGGPDIPRAKKMMLYQLPGTGANSMSPMF
uniref:Uncharacterized protein n=1 Tax=Sphaerodactylus townsendi TaxID=933632 RepID=A0ACB8F888_9SAUR